MGKRSKMIIPGNLIKPGAKLKNGEEMTNRMTGAYYGSSFELNIVAEIQISNAGILEAPATSELRRLAKPPKRKGDFGALKSETRTIAQRQLGKTVFELTTVDDIKKTAEIVEGYTTLGSIRNDLSYRCKDGRTISYAEMINLRASKQKDNDSVQAKKNALLKSRNLLPFVDESGRVIHPSWPEDVLSEIKAINNSELWSPTGVNLKLTVSGLHTIARDNAFYGGNLNQDQLDNLIDLLDYKEAKSFFKGRVRNMSTTVPIQNVNQFKHLIESFTTGIVITAFPKAVLDSRIDLVRETD